MLLSMTKDLAPSVLVNLAYTKTSSTFFNFSGGRIVLITVLISQKKVRLYIWNSNYFLWLLKYS